MSTLNTRSVSVVLPTIGRDSLFDAVDSALSQTVQPLEVLVCADTDRDLKLPRDSRVRVFRVGPRAGGNVARNTGASNARGALIALLDDDDVWHPDFLQKSLELVNDLPTSSAWLTSSRVIDPKGNVYPRRRFRSSEDVLSYIMTLRKGITNKGALMTPTMMFPAWLMQQTAWRPTQRFHQDMTWLLDVNRAHPELLVRQSAEALVYLGDPPISVTKSIAIEQSIDWCRTEVLESTLKGSKRAFGDFLLSRYPGRMSLMSGDWKAAMKVARVAASEGRPGVWAWLYFASLSAKQFTGGIRTKISTRSRSRSDHIIPGQ